MLLSHSSSALSKLGHVPDTCIAMGGYGHLYCVCQSKDKVFKIIETNDALTLFRAKKEYSLADHMSNIDVGPKMFSIKTVDGLTIIEMERMDMDYKSYIEKFKSKNDDSISDALTKLYEKMIQNGYYCIDLKPQNVMLNATEYGDIAKIRLIDWDPEFCKKSDGDNDVKLLVMQLLMANVTFKYEQVKLFKTVFASNNLCPILEKLKHIHIQASNNISFNFWNLFLHYSKEVILLKSLKTNRRVNVDMLAVLDKLFASYNSKIVPSVCNSTISKRTRGDPDGGAGSSGGGGGNDDDDSDSDSDDSDSDDSDSDSDDSDIKKSKK